MMHRAMEIAIAALMFAGAFLAARSPELDLVGMRDGARQAAVQALKDNKDSIVPAAPRAEDGLYARLLRRNIFAEDGSYDAPKKGPDLAELEQPKQIWAYKLMAITRSGGSRQAVFMENNLATVAVSEGEELKDGSLVVHIGEVSVHVSADDGRELREYRIFEVGRKADALQQGQAPMPTLAPGQVLNMPLSPDTRQQGMQRQKDAIMQSQQGQPSGGEVTPQQLQDPKARRQAATAAGGGQGTGGSPQQPQPQRLR